MPRHGASLVPSLRIIEKPEGLPGIFNSVAICEDVVAASISTAVDQQSILLYNLRTNHQQVLIPSIQVNKTGHKLEPLADTVHRPTKLYSPCISAQRAFLFFKHTRMKLRFPECSIILAQMRSLDLKSCGGTCPDAIQYNSLYRRAVQESPKALWHFTSSQTTSGTLIQPSMSPSFHLATLSRPAARWYGSHPRALPIICPPVYTAPCG
jgi:hypothetical protein